MIKKYRVDSIRIQEIIKIEERLYGLYRDVILKFEKSFSHYNCNVKIVECWTTGNSYKPTNIRPALENKYIYWICYEVQCNGKPIIYDDENSPMTRSYVALSISKVKKNHNSKVFIKEFNDTADVTEELLEDLNKIKTIKQSGDG